MNAYGLRSDALENMLNKKSGLLGVSGFSSDITDILRQPADGAGHRQGLLAVDIYVHRLKKYRRIRGALRRDRHADIHG